MVGKRDYCARLSLLSRKVWELILKPQAYKLLNFARLATFSSQKIAQTRERESNSRESRESSESNNLNTSRNATESCHKDAESCHNATEFCHIERSEISSDSRESRDLAESCHIEKSHESTAHLPFERESFEIVTMLAVLEHLNFPIEMLREIERVLVPNGVLLLTVPSRASKPVLEFLAYKLHIIDEREILDHKKYYNKGDLREAISQVKGLKLHTHRYFQCGMNNFAKIIKC